MGMIEIDHDQWRRDLERERAEAQRRAQIQAAHQREVSQLYHQIQQGMSPFQPDEKNEFHFDETAIQPELFDEESSRAQDYLNTQILAENGLAKSAIRSCNLHQLQCALGPEWYAARKAYIAQSKETQLDYFKTQCELLLLRQVAKSYIEFIKQRDFPEVLTQEQEAAFLNAVSGALKEDGEGITDSTSKVDFWGLSPTLTAMFKAHIRKRFETAKENHAADFITLLGSPPETLYRLHALQKQKVQYGEALLRQQNQRFNQYQMLLSDTRVDLRWVEFESDLKNVNALATVPALDLSAHVQTLRANRFSELSLQEVHLLQEEDADQKPEPVSTLFDYAVEQYHQADEAGKTALLLLVDSLLVRGDQPVTSFGQLDWALLSRVLTHVELPTAYGKEVAVHMQRYCEQTHNTLSHWYTRWFVDTRIKAERQQTVQAITRRLCSAGLNQVSDQAIADAVQQQREAANLGPVAGSSLFLSLARVEQRRVSGQLVALPPMAREMEMHERNDRSSALHQSGLWRNGENSSNAVQDDQKETRGPSQ